MAATSPCMVTSRAWSAVVNSSAFPPGLLSSCSALRLMSRVRWITNSCARATLAALLAWEVDPADSDVCFPRVIESEAFTAVVQHLLQYVDAQSWELVLQILIEAAQHVSETLRTVASEWSDPLSTNPDEELGGASALAEAVVWIDGSARPASRWLGGAGSWRPVWRNRSDTSGSIRYPPCGVHAAPWHSGTRPSPGDARRQSARRPARSAGSSPSPPGCKQPTIGTHAAHPSLPPGGRRGHLCRRGRGRAHGSSLA